MERTAAVKKKKLAVKRPSWDAYWMANAMLIAERATCAKGIKVGAVVVKDKRAVSTGYNGAPPGEPHCLDVGCLILSEEGSSCQRVIHAEMNAILQNSTAAQKGTLYTTHFPCLNCMRALVSSGITRIIYGQRHKDRPRYREAEKMARRQKIKLVRLSRKEVKAISAFFKEKHRQLTQEI